jgi:hypothetical protein
MLTRRAPLLTTAARPLRARTPPCQQVAPQFKVPSAYRYPAGREAVPLDSGTLQATVAGALPGLMPQ